MKTANCYSCPLRIGQGVMNLNCCKGENALSFRIIKNWKRLPGKLDLTSLEVLKKTLDKYLLGNSVAVFFISAWGRGWNGVKQAGLSELIISPVRKYGRIDQISLVIRRI